MKVNLWKLSEAITKLKYEISGYDDKVAKEVEIEVKCTEADLKENLLDLMVISAEYTTKTREGETVNHSVSLELFDAADGKKPNLIHTTKREII